MSGWRKIRPNGLPSAGRLPESCHRMAAEGMQFPWRWNGGTIFPNLDVIWGLSNKFPGVSECHDPIHQCLGRTPQNVPGKAGQ